MDHEPIMNQSARAEASVLEAQTALKMLVEQQDLRKVRDAVDPVATDGAHGSPWLGWDDL